MKYILAAFLLVATVGASAQKKKDGGERHINQNFINTLMGLVYQVPDSFRSVRGDKLESNSHFTRYASQLKVVGVEKNSIVDAHNVWRYEGLIHQDTSTEKITEWYKEYANQLHTVPNAGYKLTMKPNIDKKLEAMPDIYYRHEKANITISLRVSRSMATRINTLTVYVSQ